MIILTHRGLNPSDQNFFIESSYQAFEYFLQQGWAIEFDCAFAQNGIVITHDHTLTRITEGRDRRKITETLVEELSLCSLEQLFHLILKYRVKNSAMHLKGIYQNPEMVERLIGTVQRYAEIVDYLFIFDVKVETAKKLKHSLPNLSLGASISHPFDIERYSFCTEQTLLTLEEATTHRELYEWVWLDEWDLSDRDGQIKKFYTSQLFTQARQAGFKISVVTPELHASSPGLLGGESHPDAAVDRLFSRIEEIISLQPDAICSDYPQQVSSLCNHSVPVVRSVVE